MDDGRLQYRNHEALDVAWNRAVPALAGEPADLKVRTIGVIATNAQLTKAQASSLAPMTDDGYARAI
jgi:L-aminopeptidase/D-esterase-like protein